MKAQDPLLQGTHSLLRLLTPVPKLRQPSQPTSTAVVVPLQHLRQALLQGTAFTEITTTMIHAVETQTIKEERLH